jgi:hypothetical protein
MTLNSRFTGSFLLLGMLLFLASCNDSINNLSAEIYAMGGFSPAALARDGLAIAPVEPGDGTKAEASTLSGLLDSEIGGRLAQDHLLTSAMVQRRLASDVTLNAEWKVIAPHISAHSIKGMEATRAFTRRLGVRYLLESQIQYAEVGGGAEQVRFFSRIYDLRLHRIVWEGTGESRGYEKLFFPATPAPFLTVARAAVKGLADRLFDN